MSIRDGEIRQAVVSLLDSRRPAATICPSEVARELAPDWRPLMPQVRAVAVAMAEQGLLEIRQQGRPIAPGGPLVGPIRLASTGGKTPGPLTTPDGRYVVVNGRLWRKANPHLSEAERDALIHELMDARRALRGKRPEHERQLARIRVDHAKRALGERGPVWWSDGAPDFNRRLVKNTPYRDWFAALRQ